MRYLRYAAAAGGALMLVATSATAHAHVVAGARGFPVTLSFDDPGVGDEASIPSFGYARSPGDDGDSATHEVDLGFEFDKRITRDTAIILNDGYDILQRNGAKTQAGFENLVVTGKWQAVLSAEHEFVGSVGISREIGGTGTTHVAGDRYGSTSINLYFGKGLGDLRIGSLRPLAITGELSYTVADKGLARIPVRDNATNLVSLQLNNGNPNAWNGGLAVEYSIPYLQSEVKDTGLRGVLGNLIPIVEFTWSSAASTPSESPTTWTAAPGVIYFARWGQIGLEATLPLNRAAGPNVGVVGIIHVFFDDLLPRSLGKPLFEGSIL